MILTIVFPTFFQVLFVYTPILLVTPGIIDKAILQEICKNNINSRLFHDIKSIFCIKNSSCVNFLIKGLQYRAQKFSVWSINSIIFSTCFKIIILQEQGGIQMEYRIFEFPEKMYSDINRRFGGLEKEMKFLTLYSLPLAN